jgi:tryptophan halogenase
MAHSPESVLSDHNRFFLPFNATGTPLASAHYALHLDEILVGAYLQKFSGNIGVQRIEGHIESVAKSDSGFIDKITLKDGQ